MSVVWSLTGTTVTDTTLYMFHTVNGCIMRVYWFYSLLSFSVVHSSSFFLAFITVAVVCVMDLVVWNKRGLDWCFVYVYTRHTTVSIHNRKSVFFNTCWYHDSSHVPHLVDGDPVPDTDAGSLFYFSHHCEIGDFSRFISHTVIGRFLTFLTTDMRATL